MKDTPRWSFHPRRRDAHDHPVRSMPALYRMPIAYLAAAVVLTILGLATASGRRPTPSTPAKPAASPRRQPADSTPPRKPGESPSQPIAGIPQAADGILRTSEGLRRKVLVRTLGLVPRVEPNGRAAGGPALDYFSLHYVLEESPESSDRWLRIGPRDGPPEGWVPLDSVLEWPTRLVATPTPPGQRPPLRLYRERECLIAALGGVPCPRHGSNCPTEGQEADSPGQSSGAGLPILQTERAPDQGGSQPQTIFEVASLVQDQAPLAPPTRLPAEMIAALKQLNVVFVVDTTASMQASLDAARRLAAELVAEASRRYRDMTLRLALVEYRDAAPAYGFRARATTPFTDPTGFLRVLESVSVARAGDGSVDEQVLEGVDLALPPSGDAPNPTRHLRWPEGRAGELASKLVILIGDAPDHDRTLDRTEALAAHARELGITIATVIVPRTDRSRDEESRYRQQWAQLAEGSFRPRDRASGFAESIPPLVVDLGSADELAGRLQSLLEDRVEAARSLAALAAAEAENRLEAYVTSEGLTLEKIHPVLVDLHRGEDHPQSRPDPRLDGRKAPSVRKGWIAERMGGSTMVQVNVLMTREELDALISELLAVQQAAQGTARTLDDLLRIGTAAAAGETAFLAADRGTTSFAEHLRRRQGIPPARPDSLLRTTQRDILQADDLTRAALDERLGTCIERLVGRRAEADWDQPGRTLDRMAPVPYEWIDF